MAATRARLRSEDEARGVHKIAPDVEQTTAAELGDVPDVNCIDVVITEPARDRTGFSKLTAVPERLGVPPLRMRAHHECFLNPDTCAVPHLQQRSRLGRVQCDRLLAEHVLAGVCRPGRPGHVQVIGQGNIHGIHLGVREERFIGGVGVGDTQVCRRPRGAGAVPRGDRQNAAMRGGLHGRDHPGGRDLRHSEHAPTNLVHTLIVDGFLVRAVGVSGVTSVRPAL